MPKAERKLWSNNGSRTMAMGYHANWQGYIAMSARSGAPYVFSTNIKKVSNALGYPGSPHGTFVYGGPNIYSQYKYGHGITLNTDHSSIAKSGETMYFGDYFSSSNIGKATAGTLKIRCGYYSTGGYGYQYTIQGYSDGTSSPGSSAGNMSGDSLEYTGQDAIRINANERADYSYPGSSTGTGTYLETLKEVSWESSQPSTTNTYGTVRLRTTNTGPYSYATNSIDHSFRSLYIEGQMDATTRGTYATKSLLASGASFYQTGSHTSSGYVLFTWTGSVSAYGDWTDNPLRGSGNGTRKAWVHALY